jgi:(2Fe-2S) ferredoxin
MPKPTRHFLVCTNRRPAETAMQSCGANGSQQVVTALRRAREARGLSASVFITDTGCLGPCPAAGCSVVVYPEGVWYTGVGVDDVDEIVERHMVRGEVVERLLDPDCK